MTVDFEWLGLAEGVVDDARGATTLVAINQMIFPTHTLPLNRRPSLVVLAYDTDRETIYGGAAVEVDLSVTDPGGSVIHAVHQQIEVPSGPEVRPYPGEGIQLVLQPQLRLESYGEYCATVSLRFGDGVELSKRRRFWVTQPPQ